MVVVAVSLTIALVALMACASDTPAAPAAPTPDVAAIAAQAAQQAVQQAQAAQPAPAPAVQQGATSEEVAKAVQEALKAQEAQIAKSVEEAAKKAAEAAVEAAPVAMTQLRPEDVKVVETRTGPSYGGQIRLATASDPGSKWDMCEFKNQHMLTYSVENFLFGDYNKGPSGSGETTYLPVLGFGTDKLATGALADTWEVPDPLTYSFHVRPGVRWQDKHPTFGRPVEVDELVAEMERIKDCRWPRHDFLDKVTGDDTDGDGVSDTVTYHTNKPVSFWGYEFAWGPIPHSRSP